MSKREKEKGTKRQNHSFIKGTVLMFELVT